MDRSLFLTCKEHDYLLDNHNQDLQSLFGESTRTKWGLGGVTFYGVSDETRIKITILKNR